MGALIDHLRALRRPADGRGAGALDGDPVELAGLALLALGGLAVVVLLWLLAGDGRPGVPVGAGAGSAGASGAAGEPATDRVPGADDDRVVTGAPAGTPGREVVVHVAGRVRSPGVHRLAGGARVADAIEAAGGAGDGADLDGLNLARVLADGERVVVGGVDDDRGAAERADGRVDLNLADAGDLERLDGVGEVTAERIVQHRREHGPFLSVEELTAVPGVGEATVERLADRLAV